MLAIRLLRTGKKHQPSFKVVVTDKTNPPTAGEFVEAIGFWNPLTKERVLKGERAKYWISKGAQPSATVLNMLISEGVVEGTKIPKHKSSKKKQPEAMGPEAPAQEAEPAPAQSAPESEETPPA